MNAVNWRLSQLGRLTATAALIALVAVGVGPVGEARADTDPPVGTPATVSADALPTWQINGAVWSQATVGNTVYAGGAFTTARPPGVAVGGAGEVTVGNLMAYDITTGNRIASFNHILNGQVMTVAKSPDGTRIYVGGDFTTVDGVARSHIAAFSTATGALITNFNANINGQVRSIAATNTTVYAGGTFLSANGVARGRLAAFDATNGAVLSWAPQATDGYVWSMVLTPDNTKVVLGGQFTTLSGVSVYGMAAVDASSGAVVPWAANQTIQDSVNGAITSLHTDGRQIYGSGYAFGAGSSFEGTFGLNPDTGAINFLNDCHGDTYDTLPVGDVLYSVSHVHNCANIGSFFQTNPWSVNQKYALAQTTYPASVNTGPDDYGWNYNGQPASGVLQWFPKFYTGKVQGQAGWSLTTNGSFVAVGGEFPAVNSSLQQGLVRFAVRAAAPNKRGPAASPSAPAPSAIAIGNGKVRIGWQAAYDQDNATLTYKVYRSGTSAPIATLTQDSNFWTTPGMGVYDTSATPGSTYTYTVKAADVYNNTLALPATNTVTVAAGSPGAYVKDVTADGASQYWRLGEPSGSAAYDYAGFDDMAANAAVTRGTAGAITGDPDGASSFDGNSGFAATQSAVPGPNVFTEEAWFRTTSTTGGKIVSFGDQKTGNSSNYDRHIYMDPSGLVWFGVWNNGAYTVNTSKALNDGLWHHAVGTMDATGVTLYVDGKRIGHNGGTASAQPYSGYWRIGGDSAWNGNPYFNGDIDDVAIYPTALTVAQVQTHYVDSGRTIDLPAKPTDAYGKAVYANDPDFYWRLGERGGATAKDASQNEFGGVYAGGVTYGVNGGVTGTGDTAVTFNGTDGAVAAGSTVTNPTVYSEELWFNTTTTGGGKLIGFGSSQFGHSGGYDRHVYMFNDGRLRFGVWTGQPNVIDTPASYNDGKWHHLVATQGPDGMKLYVDGTVVGTNPQTQAQDYTGYWRVGGDTTWGGNSSDYFAGSIDEVAVYSSALSAATVAAHYKAGGGTLPNQAPTASFTSAASGLKASFDGSASSDPDGTIASYAWDFGDGTSAAVGTPTHTYAAAGTYTVALTVTDDSGATSVRSQSLTVTNTPPTAAFTSSGTALQVSFDGSSSSDPDGTIASYAWDFGDGTSSTDATPSHTYAAPGTFTVSLTVVDNAGGTGTTTRTVTAAPPNQLPRAAFTSSSVGLLTSFDGSGSSDPDGSIASYAWDFGDGSSGTGVSPSHTYAAGGSYTVKLVVTDDRSGTDSATQVVSVTAPVVAVAKDSFGRTLSSGWGSADTGGAWSLAGGVTNYSVGSNQGSMLVNAAASLTAMLNAVSSADNDASVTFTLDRSPTGGGTYFSLVGRGSSSNGYRAKVWVSSTGTMTLYVTQVVSGVESNLVSKVLAGTYVAGDAWNLRLQVWGSGPTSLQAKLWKASIVEPTAWTVATTGTATGLQGPGAVGLVGYVSGTATNFPTTITVKDFAVMPRQP